MKCFFDSNGRINIEAESVVESLALQTVFWREMDYRLEKRMTPEEPATLVLGFEGK